MITEGDPLLAHFNSCNDDSLCEPDWVSESTLFCNLKLVWNEQMKTTEIFGQN